MIHIAIEYDDTGLSMGQENALKLRVYEVATDEWVNITTGLDKVNNIIASGADTVTGCDVSCLMNIQGRLSRIGSSVKTLHIAQLLAG